MTVVVRLILRFGTNAHKDNHDNICDEVGQRVHGISYHRRTVSQYAGNKLKHHEQQITNAAHQRHFIDLSLSCHFPDTAMPATVCDTPAA